MDFGARIKIHVGCCCCCLLWLLLLLLFFCRWFQVVFRCGSGHNPNSADNKRRCRKRYRKDANGWKKRKRERKKDRERERERKRENTCVSVWGQRVFFFHLFFYPNQSTETAKTASPMKNKTYKNTEKKQPKNQSQEKGDGSRANKRISMEPIKTR